MDDRDSVLSCISPFVEMLCGLISVLILASLDNSFSSMTFFSALLFIVYSFIPGLLIGSLISFLIVHLFADLKLPSFLVYLVLFPVCAAILLLTMYSLMSGREKSKAEIAVERAYDDAYEKNYRKIYREGHDEGYDEGQASGYDDGYYWGSREGYSEGYSEGFSECQDKYSAYDYTEEDLEESYRAGYSDACYDFGKKSPYDD